MVYFAQIENVLLRILLLLYTSNKAYMFAYIRTDFKKQTNKQTTTTATTTKDNLEKEEILNVHYC